jgi:hypothetical protein
MLLVRCPHCKLNFDTDHKQISQRLAARAVRRNTLALKHRKLAVDKGKVAAVEKSQAASDGANLGSFQSCCSPII